jgi:hypothetical protein
VSPRGRVATHVCRRVPAGRRAGCPLPGVPAGVRDATRNERRRPAMLRLERRGRAAVIAMVLVLLAVLVALALS